MSEEKHCSKCGKPVPGESPRGICPACLMEQAMASRTIVTGQSDAELPPPPSPEEIAGKFPQYEILECLGRGGMGVVYKARQKSLDRWVAIKVLHQAGRDGEKFAARFEKEARTLARMSHPNIVTVFDHGETGGLFYIVMEFVDGVNLRDLLREGKMEPEQALAIVPPICEALEYAHGKGVVHRDIKPENLLLDRDGRVKIADFGIASLVGASGEKSGTPPYMAPEQSGGTVDRRADIYALGVVLYEMLTGERPEKDLVAPSRKVEVDVKIDEMVLRALEKEPERRYQTAAEFRTMVQTVVEDLPASEKAAPHMENRSYKAPPEPDAKRWKSLRLASFLGFIVLMISIAGIVFGVKIVPQWEESLASRAEAVSTGMALVFWASHFIQRVWPLMVPLLLILGVGSVTGYVVALRKQNKRTTQFRWRIALTIGLAFAAVIIGPRLLNDYLVRRAGAPISEQLARQAITPRLEAESLRWETMRFEPNTVSPSDVIVRFTKLERVGKLHGQAVVKPLDGILNLRTLDGILWRADGLEGLRGIQFNFRLGDTPDQPDVPPLQITGPAEGFTQDQLRGWVERRWKTEYPHETFEPLAWGEPETVAPHDWVTIRCKYRYTSPWAGKDEAKHAIKERYYTFTKTGDYVRSDIVEEGAIMVEETEVIDDAATALLKIKRPDGGEQVGRLQSEGIDLLREVLSREPDHVVPADRGAPLEPPILLEWEGNKYAVQSDKIVLIGEEEWTMWLSPGIDEKLIEHSDVRVIQGSIAIGSSNPGYHSISKIIAGAIGFLLLTAFTFLIHRRLNPDRRLEKTALFLCLAGVIVPLIIVVGIGMTHVFGIDLAAVASVAYVLFAVMQLAALILGIIRFSEPLGRAAAIASGILLLGSILFLS